VRFWQGANQVIDTITCTGTGATCTATKTANSVAIAVTVTSSGGTVTLVSGTTNQITVATGTTTPVLSVPSTFIAPGSIASTTSLSIGTSLTGSGSLPSLSYGAGANCAGTASTVSFNGNNQYMLLIMNTGATGTCTGQVFQLTFPTDPSITTKRWCTIQNGQQTQANTPLIQAGTTAVQLYTSPILTANTQYVWLISNCGGY
jgi:hypothetical protein